MPDTNHALDRPIVYTLRDILAIVAVGETNTPLPSTVSALLAKSLGPVTDDELLMFANQQYGTPEAAAFGLVDDDVASLFEMLRHWRNTNLSPVTKPPVVPVQEQETPFEDDTLRYMLEADLCHITEDDAKQLSATPPVVTCIPFAEGFMLPLPLADEFDQWEEEGGNLLSDELLHLIREAVGHGYHWLRLVQGGPVHINFVQDQVTSKAKKPQELPW